MPKKAEFWHAARDAVQGAPTRQSRQSRRLPLTLRVERARLNQTAVVRISAAPKGSSCPVSFALVEGVAAQFKPHREPRHALGLTISRSEEALIRLEFALPEEFLCWGLGERYGSMNLRSRVHTLITTDNHHHVESVDALYKSVPVLFMGSPRRTWALFIDSPAPQRWDLDSQLDERATVEVFSRRGFSAYLIGPAALPEVVTAYTLLTGRTPLPPRWSLGHQQSRWSYPSEATVRAIAKEFRERHIPCDTIVLDIDYMHEYRAFTISRERFPNFEQMIQDLAKQGFRVVPIVDPGIIRSRDDATYREGQKRDVFCRTASGAPFVGKVWPGRCCFPDFVREDVRAFWAERLQFLLDKGAAGIWNDMNEPALFGQQRPFDPSNGQLPPASDQLFMQTAPEGEVGHLEVRGLYGMQMARAACEAQRAARPDQRSFTLTRSTYAGGQRYGAVWLGDNLSWFEHLRLSIPMLLNMGLCGFAQAGVDIGGFGGNSDAELLMRWYQVGIFYPFFRNHCAMGQRAQEPWAFGAKVEACIRRLIRVRTTLTRYIERLFVEHRETGAPLMRPLSWHYPEDERAAKIDDEFLFGPDLLVAPIVTRAQRERLVYLPEGDWEPFDGGKVLAGGRYFRMAWEFESVPAFVRHGAIVPFVQAFEHVGQLARREIVLKCFGQTASGRLWLDDGESMAYERGSYDDWRISVRRERITVTPHHQGYEKRPRRVMVELGSQRVAIELTPRRESRRARSSPRSS
ncbi:MAG: TIM-barrel domain-containing protein [Myxococcales bacterium]